MSKEQVGNILDCLYSLIISEVFTGTTVEELKRLIIQRFDNIHLQQDIEEFPPLYIDSRYIYVTLHFRYPW